MVETILLVAAIAASVALGAAPSLLPSRVSLAARWVLALGLLAASIWFHLSMSDGPHAYHLILLAPFWFGWAVGAIMLALIYWNRRRVG